MAELRFSTTDLDVATGRTKVLTAINAQAATVGLAGFFPAGSVDKPHVHLEVPGSAVAHLIAEPYKSIITQDTIVIDTADGLIMFDGVAKGYFMDILVLLRYNPGAAAGLVGILSSRWTSKATSSRKATTEEKALDPGVGTNITWKESDGVMFQSSFPSVRQHKFVGID